jgi:hypothetical protein
MAPKHKVAVLALCVVLACGVVGCSGSVAEKETPRVATAPDGGQEEVLDESDEARDDFGRPTNTDTEAGGVLMSLTYLATTIGSAVLPLLMLM